MSKFDSKKEILGMVNSALQDLKKYGMLDLSQISDGYHTFSELYEHRITLWIAFCEMFDAYKAAMRTDNPTWRSKKHSDGSSYDGWFILGVGSLPGEQITYHIPMSKWEDCDFAITLDKAPEFDGHTSNDVLKRLRLI